MSSLEVLVFAPLIVFGAYLVFGMAGFGSTLIAVPLLVHLLPVQFVIPMVLLLDCVSAAGLGFKLREQVWKEEFKPLLPFLLAGLVAGAFVLLRLPTPWLLFSLGTFVILFGVNFLRVDESPLRLPRWAAAPAGLFAGVTSSAFGVGGPIYVFYFTARGATPDQIRATVPAVFTFTTIARIAIFTGVGLFNRDVLIASAALLLPMGLGLYCGNRLHGRLSRAQAVRIVGGLLVLSGVTLLLRAVGELQ
jgi:uncharacterized membrane protein YfcA